MHQRLLFLTAICHKRGYHLALCLVCTNIALCVHPRIRLGPYLFLSLEAEAGAPVHPVNHTAGIAFRARGESGAITSA
jgi:hypothetical protein